MNISFANFPKINLFACIQHMRPLDALRRLYCIHLYIFLCKIYWVLFPLLKVHEDKTKVRRNPDKSLPELNKGRREDLKTRSIYAVCTCITIFTPKRGKSGA